MATTAQTLNKYAILLAVTFIILKAFGWLNLSWVQSALPLIIYAVIRIIILTIALILHIRERSRR